MDKIRERKKKDQEMLFRSSQKLYGSIRKKTEYAPGEESAGKHLILADILQYYGMEIPELSGDTDGEMELEVTLQKTGLLMRKITLEGKWWTEAAVPLLVSDEEGGEYALLPGRQRGYISMKSGTPTRLTNQEAARIQEKAYCFYKPFPKSETGMKFFWKFLFTSISKWDLVSIIGISILLELCGLLMPYINNMIYNTVIPSGTSREIPGIIVLVIGTVIFSTLIGLTRTLSVNRIGVKMKIAGQSAVFSRLFQLPVSFFKRYDSGELFHRTNAVNDICEILGGGLIPAALTAMLSVIYLVQISWFAGALVIPSVVIILLLLINIFLACFLQVRQSRKTNIIQNQVSSILYQLVNGITKIRTAGAEVRAFHVWSCFWEKMPVIPALYLQISPIVGSAISLGGSVVLYMIAWKSRMTASSYIAFQTAFSSFAVSVMALADFGQQLGCLKPAVDMIRPILEEQPELQEDCEYVKKLRGEIELSNVKFRYTPEMPYVINDMSLHIEPGEYLGIVGASGCGKSTLMRLLLGFEVPETGSVYYDEKDINNMDLPSLRRRIGVVLQNGSLFTGDILSNLSICAPWLTMEEAWDAARRAGFAEDIENMPMGMFTMLSDNGGGISGGQKQRLLIARAIAAKPDILLFDEATSALDNQTQATVVQTLKEMECTRLVIAHRLSTIMDCDRIIYLEKGQIVEQGTYEELMARDGAFARLAARQLA